MEEQIEELTLLLAYLTSWEQKEDFADGRFTKAWKGYSFPILNKLEDKNYIWSTTKRNKLMFFREDGIKRAKELMDKYGIKSE